MSHIGKNIKKIRTVKKINQADFADLFGLARASVGGYEEGRAEPKIDTIIAIANHFGISIDMLLKKELTVNELYRFDIFKPELHQLAEPEMPLAKIGDIPYLPAAQVGEFVLQQGATALTSQLPQLALPFLPKENHTAFEVFEPNAPAPFIIGDILIGKKLGPKSKPKDGLYYMVLGKTLLTLQQWPASITPAEITSLWEITHTISAANKPLPDLEQRVGKLERLVEELRGRVGR